MAIPVIESVYPVLEAKLFGEEESDLLNKSGTN
jgi:hypothetical protein